ncbi:MULTISPECIES: bifunctional cytidylate kinase/GTPase Der [unclassified Actinomyces]|uniref:bifunctional cytidylate kinase/GTPase Der n=1 Tax=unclassified Actinomyces TaxID=2609248 RepID=UPI002016BB09|nr:MULTISPECIES: bifunctional cytidylate kinase/GTPase Der [unclassified Actinomyces]MCL3777482.1 bifunctional cytidylate kinase/GTPase Der [Actinomyces sp. AC-20-1]MCL3788922.1 bifunctional cytidylate kinase/GTPase Der [Actinomyces sp. 187325]MCL3791558.1 bifunctional cytidylate kinase/GTPase Der [Actinomyces sp. 186855]MCL3794195.1 bifunctional cytidylate kinase/GTPase Der [Actinomyces sp. 217892]
MGIVVAIDGPSGSGKSTVARRVAAELGLAYLDTGAMYRAAAWWCERTGIDLSADDVDATAVTRAVETMPLDMGLDPETPGVVCDGVDIAEAIREPHVAAVVSTVATNLDVRAELARLQREIIHQEKTSPVNSFSGGAGIVAEGRDITTVIAPDADTRLLITASEETRLARRAGDLEAAGKDVDAAALRDQVLRRDRDDATVSQFLTAPEGVTLVDTSDMDLPETIEHVIDLIETAVDEAAARDAEDELRADALRAGLEDYELDEEDLALLEAEEVPAADEGLEAGLPVLAVIGRPNVGKSTLVNRVLGRRVAVVQDTPGVTRDRVSYPAEWAGRRFTIVDTGGWELDVEGLDSAVATQAEVAVAMSDAVILVVDATVGITETDAQVVRMLRRSGKPVVLAANKVDSPAQEGDAAALWNLGLGEPYAVSALHGRGSGDVLDAAMAVLPEVSAVAGPSPAEGSLHRIALVGRPNVGKSSLLNAIAGSQRVVVNELAGTTRDPVDEVIELDGRQWLFIDTAGIRRRVRQTRGADYYAVLRTQGAIEKAEVAVVLLDASEPITEQDVRVIQQVVDAGRALVLVNNKWDLVEEERRKMLAWETEHDLAHVAWAPHINLAARTGWHTNRLVRALDAALEGWTTRIPTGRLNAFLGEIQGATPHPLRGGKQPRILFATQVQTAPPRIVLFTTGFLDAGYRRFIERRLREEFGFVGSPVQIGVRVREKRDRRERR